jgi:hypothetical protein
MNFRISDQMMDTKQPQVFSSWSEAGTRSIQPADGSTDFFFWSFAQNHCLPRKTRENHCVYISKSEKCPDFPVGMPVRADANAMIIVAGLADSRAPWPWPCTAQSFDSASPKQDLHIITRGSTTGRTNLDRMENIQERWTAVLLSCHATYRKWWSRLTGRRNKLAQTNMVVTELVHWIICLRC